MATLLILEELDSPLMDVKAMAAAARPEQPVPIPNAAILDAIFVFSRPAREVWPLLKSGLDAFHQAAIEFGDTIPVGRLPDLGSQIQEAVARAVSTIVAPEKKTATHSATPPTPTA